MKYNIEKTGDLDFNPTELDIIVKEPFIKKIEEEDVEFIGVTSILTQKGEVSITQRATQHEFPYSVWAGLIVGYNDRLKEPILDEIKLGQILSTFKVKLV